MKDLLTDQDQTLRSALRDATRGSHDALDRRIMALDLRTEDGFAAFCRCHVIGFGALRAKSDVPAMQQELDTYIARLRSDLTAMGKTVPVSKPASDGSFDPLSVAYIVHGSRLGTKMLRKVWKTSESLSVKRAKAYMSGDIDSRAWLGTCNRLEEVGATTPRGQQVTTETNAIFALFQRSLDQALAPSAERHATDHDGHLTRHR